MRQSETMRKIDLYVRAELQSLLDQCTKPQQDMFARIYPEGIADMDEEKLKHAIRQCEATIKMNRNG